MRGAMKVMATNPVAQARQMSEFMPAYRQAPTVPGALPALSARDQAMIRALMQGNIAAQQQTPQVNVGVRPGYFGQQ